MTLPWPLAGVNPTDPTDGGFGFLEWNSYPGYAGDAYHPGIDFNSGAGGDADCGEPVVTPEAGTVRAVVDHTSSFGLHVWVETDSGRWLHFCHLQSAGPGPGHRVAALQVIGYCGKSARGRNVWPYCHLHFEVRRAKPPTWDYWPSFLAREQVAADYEDPLAYLAGLERAIEIVYGWTPYYTETNLSRRDLRGIVLHDTETDLAVAPHSQGSWHYEIDRDGTILEYVDEADVAWHVRDCDRMWPDWLPHSSPFGPSPANCWTLGIELVSNADDRARGEPFSDAQYAALRALLADIRARYGPLPLVGHGQLQRDRSDPVAFDWARLEENDPDVSEADRAILEVMHGLNANADSVSDWINQIGALRAENLQLHGDVQALMNQLAEAPVAPSNNPPTSAAVWLADGTVVEFDRRAG